MTSTSENLPIAVVGAGPVGLAAAAHLLERGLEPIVFEAGDAVAASVRQWAHVRLFSPWRYTIDAAGRRLLEADGWSAPDDDALPTGGELVSRYLEPLAATAPLAATIRLRSRVVAIARDRVDKLKDPGRDEAPFVLRIVDGDGREHDVRARAVVDASGTWTQPNPMGANGLAARGERAAADRIRYGLPDVLGADRARYAGRRVLVLGSGHSAMNNLLSLFQLAEEVPGTTIVWGLRRLEPGALYGGGVQDALPARAGLGERLRLLVHRGGVRLLAGLRVGEVRREGDELLVLDVDGREAARVDEIVVATGARPDLEMLREVRLDLDPALESPRRLGPMIDPNLHSCGTVPPHGAFELEQPEAGLFVVGTKSYGRAPTFLLATGFEQVRSVAAYLAGDLEAAREVHLELPETGVCTVDVASTLSVASGCCGGPPPADRAGACCAADAEAKAAGGDGCGCGSRALPIARPEAAAACCA